MPKKPYKPAGDNAGAGTGDRDIEALLAEIDVLNDELASVRKAAEKAKKAGRADAFEKNQAERLNLNKSKLALDQEYGELMRVKKTLLKDEPEAMKTETGARAHREKVVRLNERIVDFEKRRKAFQEKIDAFNTDSK